MRYLLMFLFSASVFAAPVQSPSMQGNDMQVASVAGWKCEAVGRDRFGWMAVNGHRKKNKSNAKHSALERCYKSGLRRCAISDCNWGISL